MSKPKIIAFYLPQYHPTPDNDKWWGKGFTEWTNVGKAKPLYRGHYQPKVPADLGYYDLRLPEVREAQAELAKKAGIYGFCYYHYWFGNGKEELELPFNEVLKLGKPDFPFMLCWANESWHKKFWDKDGVGSSKEMLLEQTYPGEQDHINHFYRLLPAFKDRRYIKIDGKPAFMIYKPFDFPGIEEFLALWNKLAKKEGLNGIFFIAHLQRIDEYNKKDILIKKGFNGINISALGIAKEKILKNLPYRIKDIFYRKIRKIPFPYEYKTLFPLFKLEDNYDPKIFPTIIPNWDHSPRSDVNGYIIHGSTPELFGEHVMDILSSLQEIESPIIFLKSWNEWGEGNYMEPDLKFGLKYIEKLKEILSNY